MGQSNSPLTGGFSRKWVIIWRGLNGKFLYPPREYATSLLLTSMSMYWEFKYCLVSYIFL